MEVAAAAGTFVLLIGPIEDPKAVDWDDIESWCRKTPVVGWKQDREHMVPFGPGRECAAGDVFLLPGGMVYSADHETTFANLQAYVQAQWFEGAKVPIMRGETVSEVPTLSELGISARATNPLAKSGITTLSGLAQQKRAEVAKVRGVSRDTIKEFDALLEAEGLSWADVKVEAEIESKDEADPEDLI